MTLLTPMKPIQHPTMGWRFGVGWVGLTVAAHLVVAVLLGFPYGPIGNWSSWDSMSWYGQWVLLCASGGSCWGGVIGLIQARILRWHGVPRRAAHRWWAATALALGLIGAVGAGVPKHLNTRADMVGVALIVAAAYALVMKPVVAEPHRWMAAIAGAWLGGIAMGSAIDSSGIFDVRFTAGAAVGLMMGMGSWWMLRSLRPVGSGAPRQRGLS